MIAFRMIGAGNRRDSTSLGPLILLLLEQLLRLCGRVRRGRGDQGPGSHRLGLGLDSLGSSSGRLERAGGAGGDELVLLHGLGGLGGDGHGRRLLLRQLVRVHVHVLRQLLRRLDREDDVAEKASHLLNLDELVRRREKLRVVSFVDDFDVRLKVVDGEPGAQRGHVHKEPLDQSRITRLSAPADASLRAVLVVFCYRLLEEIATTRHRPTRPQGLLGEVGEHEGDQRRQEEGAHHDEHLIGALLSRALASEALESAEFEESLVEGLVLARLEEKVQRAHSEETT
ncbi:hypothetical protein PENTCL1PPCAC_24144, partial [Pristionchus entomophagus]